tara:strand:+ start:136 stop:1128 length:993 start_codon:yes stop_codon:yes gene_type:complete
MFDCALLMRLNLVAMLGTMFDQGGLCAVPVQAMRIAGVRMTNRLEADLVIKKTSFVVSGLVALVGLTALLPVVAQAEDADLRSINNRLDRIERSVSDMRRNGGSSNSGGDAGSLSTDAQVRLSELEDQIRSMMGRIEELGHKIDVVNQDLQTYKEANDLRFQNSGGASAAAGADAPAASPAAAKAAAAPARVAEAAPTVTLPNGTPQVQYDFAIDLLKRGDFPKARDGFKQFLQAHPKDPLAGNAQYWLGETYYVQGQYKDAADSFLKGYTTYSKSTKAPDSLLKLGMTLVALKQKDAACATFGQLKEQFPSASPAIVARNKQERQKAGC